MNVYIKNKSDHLTQSFMIYEMCGYQCMITKGIHIIFVSMTICSIAKALIITYTWRKRNKYYSVLIQKYFCEKKLPFIENLRIKSLSCFKHQINIIVLLSCAVEMSSTSNQCFGVLIVLQHFLAKLQHSVKSIF